MSCHVETTDEARQYQQGSWSVPLAVQNCMHIEASPYLYKLVTEEVPTEQEDGWDKWSASVPERPHR